MSLLSALANPKPRPQLPAPGVAFSLFSESAAHRAELASLEVEEARDHSLISILLAAALAAFILFTGFAVTLLFASLVWDNPNRVWWLAGLCVVYLGAAVWSGLTLTRRLRDWRPLDETQAQLKEDFQCLSQLIKSIVR